MQQIVLSHLRKMFLVPTALTMTVDSLVNVSCKDSADATIALTASGGTAPYSYAWNGPNSFTVQIL